MVQELVRNHTHVSTNSIQVKCSYKCMFHFTNTSSQAIYILLWLIIRGVQLSGKINLFTTESWESTVYVTWRKMLGFNCETALQLEFMESFPLFSYKLMWEFCLTKIVAGWNKHARSRFNLFWYAQCYYEDFEKNKEDGLQSWWDGILVFYVWGKVRFLQKECWH
jgi:hypothetical protein